MEKISIIVPCYNEEKAINIYYNEINKVIKNMKDILFEIIFIDDGSTDNTLSELKKLAKKDKQINYISFSRNFGKEAAMYAGLENFTGDYVVIMDVDLQDPPKLIPKMFKYIKEGYDVVATRRVTRKGEPVIRSFFARKFYKLINKMSKVEMVDGARDFRLMKKNVAKSILNMNEYNRYSKGLFSFVGYKTKWLEYDNVKRSSGKTKWSFMDLVKYAIDGIVDFSSVPLVISFFFGIILTILSFIGLLICLIKGISCLVFLFIFLFGIQFVIMGIIGIYLSKVYLETKKRPIYIIREKN